MKTNLLVLAAILFLPTLSSAQDLESWEAMTYTSYNGTILPYRLLSPPELEEGHSYPLVIFLHGAGERGSDNESQLKHIASSFEGIQEAYPAFVLFPQVAEGDRWSSGTYDAEEATVAFEYQAGSFLSATMSVMDMLIEEHPIDVSRVYIGGLSMGGFGTWDAIARWPELFAAAFPICGAGDPAQADRMTGVPVWVLHGGDDQVVPVEASRQMVSALKDAGGTVIYTEFEGVGHNSWDPAFETRLLLDWMFAQRKE